MLVPYQEGSRAVFLYAKHERENIGPDELLTWREIGALWLAKDERDLALAISEKELEEVIDAKNDQT
jgi:hypothetical protein